MAIEGRSDLGQHRIPGPPPVARVVGGELVNVEQNDADGPAPKRGGEFLLQHEIQQPPVRQACQRVAVGKHQRVTSLAVQQLGDKRQTEPDRQQRHGHPEQQGPLDPQAQRVLGEHLEHEHAQGARNEDAQGGAPTAIVGEEEGGDQDQQPRERVVAAQQPRLAERSHRGHTQRREAQPEGASGDLLTRTGKLFCLDLGGQRMLTLPFHGEGVVR